MPVFAANLTMLFTEVPFMERFALAREAGFEFVEYLFPYDFKPEDLKGSWTGMACARSCSTCPAATGGAGTAASQPIRAGSKRSAPASPRRWIMPWRSGSAP